MSWDSRADVRAQAQSLTLRLLLGDREGAREAARAFDERAGWLEAVEYCSAWGVLPPLYRRIEELGVSLDAPAREQYGPWAKAVFLQSAASLYQGARALSALTNAGVEAVAVKGVAAIASLYRGPQDRTIGDADVLVREGDVKAAVEALERIGFRLGPGVDLDRHVVFARKHPIDGNRAVAMFAPDGSEIDLHWHIGRVSTDAVLAAARQAEVYGVRIRTVNPAHGFLLGVHHILRNGFALHHTLRDFVDGRCWLAALAGSADAAPAVREAIAWGLAAPALATLQILAHFDPSGPAAAWAPAFADGLPKSERRLADSLTECFLLQPDAELWNVDLPRLVNPGKALQFVRRVIDGRPSYTPSPFVRANGAGPREPSLGVRLRRLARVLPRARWRLVWALRTAQNAAFEPPDKA